ncbi:GntR family transcriptional regulator [Nocardia sp. BMG51109]|uniref:GntR family transcriptional regulator n=1 Tax=Nocardia sp. BMG51109 TaxID=1056816 RepID=UPI0018DC424D|nr:GntR family transcriptional regulator [Nocardia sp. BMG51109]
MVDEANVSPRRGLAPIPTSTRVDAVIAEVRRAIVLGRIKPGEKLTEAYLCSSLGVSRPTVREALTKMSRHGLLVQEPYRGLRVTDLDPQKILDIAAVRVALDLQAAEAILADRSGRRMARLRDVWNAYQRQARSTDPLVLHETHITFHRGMWEASENSFLMALWPATEAHMTVVLAHDQATRQDGERALAMHKALVDAVESGQRDLIRDAFAAHTLESAQFLARTLSEAG